MMTLKVKDKEYQIKYGYNNFCDTDLLDRTSEMLDILRDRSTEKDNAFTRRMFILVRELVFEGLKKMNPVDSIEEVGDILDDYFDEGTEKEPHGLMDIFGSIAHELLAEGFIGDLLKTAQNAVEKKVKTTKITKR